MHDVVALGEVLLRLSIVSPERFETVGELDVQIGGAEANVAATCARLGLATALVSALPLNPWGDRVRRELEGHGVDCRPVRMLEDTRLGLYFVEHGAAPRPSRILYDRRDSAFARLRPQDVDWEPVRRARVVHLSGVTPALGDAARALVERALGEAAVVSFDVNYRARLWSPESAREFLTAVLPLVRYLFVGESEARTVFRLTGPPEQILGGLAGLAPKAIVSLLQGHDGSIVLDGDRTVRPRIRPLVHVVDAIGAGDAYVAGFLWATLEGRELAQTVDVASAVAALKCSLWGDVAAIRPVDVEELLAGGPDVRR